jgi:hypothetical protein
MVYKNVTANGNLLFELYNDDIKHYDPDIDMRIGLYISPADIPGVGDIDGDGDMDVLSFDVGGGNITFYSNQSQEVYGHSDSFNMVVATYCWGRFMESDNNDSIIFAPRCFLFKKGQHAGSNMLPIDMDDDGDMDLLLADVSSKHITLLENGWNPRSGAPHVKDTMIGATYSWPKNTKPVELDLFPSIHWCDLDFDGVNDLVLAPGSQEERFVVYNTWQYRNKGTNKKPVFEFVRDDFIQGQTIETGERSYPALFDHDHDGDQDLFVASPSPYTNFEYDSAFYRIYYYQNIGSPDRPLFELADTDFLGLTKHKYPYAHPTFGDADNDGSPDLLIGLVNGRIAFFKNMALPTSTPKWEWQSDDFMDIKVSNNAAPFVHDVNRDGKMDLILGDFVGKVAYYAWDKASGKLALKNDNWLEINVGTVSIGFSKPVMGDFDSDGEDELIVADNFGRLNYYNDLDLANNTATLERDKIYSEVTNTSYYHDFGREPIPAVGHLNGDKHLDLLLGNYRGGLYFLEGYADSGIGMINSPARSNIQVYPNPVHEVLHVRWDGQDKLGYLVITGLSGKTACKAWVENGSALPVGHLPQGVYVLRVQFNDGSFYATKLVKPAY